MLTSDIATLRAFVDNVVERAEQNINQVIPITLAVVGGILWRATPGSVELQQIDSTEQAYVLWASFDDRRMVFSYNHMTAIIELREGNLNDHPMDKFSYRMLQADIENFFGIAEE